MQMKRQEIKEELSIRSENIKNRVNEVLGSISRDVDFSYIELLTVMFHYQLRHDPSNPGWSGRDKLVVSNLKVLPSLLALLADVGYIKWREFHSLVLKIPGFFKNPNVSLVKYPGIDFIIDSPFLGMVHSMGYALMGSSSQAQFRVYHILTEQRSASIQKTLISTAENKLSNLTCIIPFLDLQKRATSIHFWFSMGWQLEEVRFAEINSIFEGFHRTARSKEKPQILIG